MTLSLWILGRDPLMSHSALSHDRAAWKAAHIAGEQQLAFYQGSNKTVIHHGLYLLNNAVCLCVYTHTVAVTLHMLGLCKQASYEIKLEFLSVCLIELNSE